MTHVAVIGAGITGVTTAYSLVQAGFEVSVLDRHRYPAMETSFANGGQLSASHTEVWNSMETLKKAFSWMRTKEAPLLFNPRFSWHKYSWLAEFMYQIRHHRVNSVACTRLAIEARRHLFAMATAEGIDFDLEQRGILHLYHDRVSFEQASHATQLLKEGGLERSPVTNEEIHQLEPSLRGRYFGGFYTPSDSTGDIHKFTRGLARACARKGVAFIQDAVVQYIKTHSSGVEVQWKNGCGKDGLQPIASLHCDAVVVCAGVGSRHLANMLGDRINVYPVKGYSVTVDLSDADSVANAPWVSLLDEQAKIVTSRLGENRLRVAGTAEFSGENWDIRADRIRPLVQWVRDNLQVETEKVTPWAGLRPMTPSMLPVVARGKRPRVYYNTGHGHLGWTLSGATAAMVTSLVHNDLPS
ncbi:D-amino acid dehydrogenase [Lampropedia puyangensis]|uniref:D-amino acid dehydrogenase n=1 Tax=Lampropedia puyangensis TaxID=1330072 RepID=A0A4S8FD31_9BURK|nr:D-amino acid dehydrogenase [Lampropedia puyangensis]THU05209.1 D-amino acid dehydrogenase [Lampropedia puyangensis]